MHDTDSNCEYSVIQYQTTLGIQSHSSNRVTKWWGMEDTGEADPPRSEQERQAERERQMMSVD